MQSVVKRDGFPPLWPNDDVLVKRIMHANGDLMTVTATCQALSGTRGQTAFAHASTRSSVRRVSISKRCTHSCTHIPDVIGCDGADEGQDDTRQSRSSGGMSG